MKYLLFTLEYFPFKGGVANYYTNLIYYWPKSSDIVVLNNNNNELLRSGGVIKWLPGLFKITKFIKKSKIDHVLVGHILPLGIITLILKKTLGIKYTVFLHGLDFSLATRNCWKRFLSKAILNNSKNIICANSMVKDMLLSFVGVSEKSIIVNPGVKKFDFSLDKNRKVLIDKYKLQNKKIIFSLGRLVKRKGFDNVIRSLKNFQDRDDLLYIISGSGPDRLYLEELAEKELGVDWKSIVLFTNEISELDKWTFFDLSDIFVMPSRNIFGDFEGFGIVYLEANLSGKPVIAGNSGGVADAVINNFNGLLIDPEDVNGIFIAIDNLLSDPILRDKLGQQGRERAIKDFDWKKQVEVIYNFLMR